MAYWHVIRRSKFVCIVELDILTAYLIGNPGLHFSGECMEDANILPNTTSVTRLSDLLHL
jgi:hypothetical protein